MKKLYLNFYNFKIELNCQSEKIVELLKKDFSHFVTDLYGADLQINASITESVDHLIPEDLIAKKQNARAISFEINSLRYNYFYGKAVSIFDSSKSYIEVYSKNEDYLHELLYLVILSRQTKFHDLHGLHKVHAFGIAKDNCNLIGMMDSKGGKTTLFSYFLDEEDVELISDDTPVINRDGDVLAFPIRIGYELNSYTRAKLKKYESKAYDFYREEYGPKKLVDIKEFSNQIAQKSSGKTILFQGKRIFSKNQCTYKKISKIKMWGYLCKNMIIGVGLPMVLEYYLEASFQDKFKRLNIILRRSWAAFNLLKKSECYEVYLSFDPEVNHSVLNELIELHK